MKSRRIMLHPGILRTPTFRFASFVRKRKNFLLQYHYGTSSKQGATKLNILNSVKNLSDNFLPAVLKSVTIASSLFGSFNFKFRKSTTDFQDTAKDYANINYSENNKNNKLTSKESSLLTAEKIESSAAQLNSVLTEKDVIKKVEGNQELEQTFFEWLTGSDFHSKRKEFLGKDEKPNEKYNKISISKSSLQQRSRFLVSSLNEATSSASQLLRLEEVCKHLILYPDQKSVMCKAGLMRIALRLKYNQNDQAVQAQARCVLALIGFQNPPRGNGIRILSIDGGGTRGILAIEILRQLEAKTNKKIYQLFDYFCGVSSGAILGLLLGGLRLSLDECESLYRTLSDKVFSQSTFWGTSRLMWSHAYYDTTMWVDVLKKTFGERLLIDTVKEPDSPKLAVVSAIMNLPHLQPFVFRNYDLPPGVQSYHRGSCRYRMWESVRASGAAPGYFEEYCLDEFLHQDGGVMINNPTALAIHEARLLWPSEYIQCVMSLGTGRYIPAVSPNFTSTSLKTKVLKIIDSATDTEAVHVALNDLLLPNTYFRMNPYLTEFFTLDENRTDKLDQMKSDAQMYLRRNEYKFANAAQTLTTPRSLYKKTSDWLNIQKNLYL
ncbi:calcium-independent phospholipase A2-gamma [Parasteatoda tepidariorum]|uniref:calcium-independent phospholipase A2-gamma n=1 Tax=Parasteatoda tepidariorum TaxID=114398 RepID=UPI00077F96DB|nr:calcium-independent phospholipase A2-gamma [Parasteatoda tepidariorum]